jgi:ubiquinone/menaquinone biosynthesis C-methylase UbiE
MSEQTNPTPSEGLAGRTRPHPVFARVYTKVAEMSERRGGAEHRHKLLAGLSGRVIEVGAGSGANFSHYPTSVSEVVAVEPERYLRERAQQAAARAPVPVSVVDGGADLLPGEPGSFDAGAAALVLCTVPDQQRALAELFRVIRSGGELRFYEHVVGHSKWEARFQRLADATFWPHVAGGCHLARDTTTAIEQAGFVIETCERFAFSPAPFLPPDPHILGTARRP